MHDAYQTSVDAALETIDTLTAEGYTFVTIEECLIAERIRWIYLIICGKIRSSRRHRWHPGAPSTLDEVVGQKHIIGKDKLLYRAIKADKLGSLIFYGPPGTGKTTLARVIANTTSARFEQLNATVAGKKDMEQVVQDAKDALGMYGKRTILFIDEIHRFNKGQQDYLLPFVEDGTILLIGATTENPYFEVNGALISRSRIFELKPLENADIRRAFRAGTP